MKDVSTLKVGDKIRVNTLKQAGQPVVTEVLGIDPSSNTVTFKSMFGTVTVHSTHIDKAEETA